MRNNFEGKIFIYILVYIVYKRISGGIVLYVSKLLMVMKIWNVIGI